MIYWGHLSLIKLLKFVVDLDLKYVFKGMMYAVVVFSYILRSHQKLDMSYVANVNSSCTTCDCCAQMYD